jgi:prevent-host-death family protein
MTVTVNIHEAKTHLSRLVELAAKGNEFIIAKAGKPMVRVVPIQAVPAVRTLGFLAGQGVIEIEDLTPFLGSNMQGSGFDSNPCRKAARWASHGVQPNAT